MPKANTQRYLFIVGFVGVMTSCFGCGLAANNQIGAAQIALVVAWLILVPLFGYLLRTRRQLKKVVRKQQARQGDELVALASLGSEAAEQEAGSLHDAGAPTRDFRSEKG